MCCVQELEELEGSEAEVSNEEEDAGAKAERLGRRLADAQGTEVASTSGREAAAARVQAAARGAKAQGKRVRKGERDAEQAELDDVNGRVCETDGPVDLGFGKIQRHKAPASTVAVATGQNGTVQGVLQGFNHSRSVLADAALKQREELLSAQPGLPSIQQHLPAIIYFLPLCYAAQHIVRKHAPP
jgi:hypothetical protein